MQNCLFFFRMLPVIALLLWPINATEAQQGSVYNFSDQDEPVPTVDVSSIDQVPTVEQQRPYVLLLPGILGEQIWDRRISLGIQQSGFPCDTEIYDWTNGPLMMVSNIGGDHGETLKLIRSIHRFRKDFPQRPLILIGHSGGCRMVVRVLEELGDQPLVDRAVLLSPGLESTYDLRQALRGTQSGIVTFYSNLDFPVSAPLTFAKGITQFRLDASAATFGFKTPRNLSPEDSENYSRMLIQRGYRAKMLTSGNAGGHFGWTVPRFDAGYIVPWLNTQSR